MDLRELQKTYLDNLRKVTEDKLEIGSLVRTVISIEEGLVFKDGRKQKPKKLVIIGVDYLIYMENILQIPSRRKALLIIKSQRLQILMSLIN